MKSTILQEETKFATQDLQIDMIQIFQILKL